LETFAVFHMQGYWDADGTQIVEAIRRSVGNPRINVLPMPWPLMRLVHLSRAGEAPERLVSNTFAILHNAVTRLAGTFAERGAKPA
jgi:hypothetical protein